MGQNMNVFPQNVTVPAKGFADISFGGATPNYWRVHNPGDTSIYFGIRSLPSKTWYDFKVGAGQSRMYCEQYGISKFTCYNDSTNDVTILIQSFNSIYDNAVLAFSDYNLSGDQEIPVVVGGFSQSLPTGTNNIGKVTWDENSEGYSELSGALSLWHQRFVYSYTILPGLVTNTLTAGNQAYYPDPINTNVRVQRISFIANDGINPLTLTIGAETNKIDIKPGEVLNDIKMYMSDFIISSELGTTYRMIYEVVQFI